MNKFEEMNAKFKKELDEEMKTLTKEFVQQEMDDVIDTYCEGPWFDGDLSEFDYFSKYLDATDFEDLKKWHEDIQEYKKSIDVLHRIIEEAEAVTTTVIDDEAYKKYVEEYKKIVSEGDSSTNIGCVEIIRKLKNTERELMKSYF